MQELRCFGGGACVAISQQGLEWLYKRKCTDEKITTRDGSFQLRISKNHMVPGESEQQLSVYLLHDCGSSSTNTRPAESTVCPLPALDSCGNQHAFTLLPLINSTNAERPPWTDLPHTIDNINYFTKNLNCNPEEKIVILYNDNVIAKLISDAVGCQDVCSMEIFNSNIEDIGCKDVCSMEILNANIEDSERPDTLKNKNHPSQSQRDVINTDSCICEGEMEKKSGPGIRRKSVSFADDVIVYLYDKNSPAHKSHPEPDNRTSSSSSYHSEILFDDNGLEWEDDFLALERNCHPHNHPKSCLFSLPTPNWTLPKPKSLFLPHSCLFLTHVNESDLEP